MMDDALAVPDVQVPPGLATPTVSAGPPLRTDRILHARWLGRQPYDAAHALQLELRDRVIARTAEPTVLLLEHEPVITFGRRFVPGDLLVTEAELQQRGITCRHAERGGRATYHGPGQLVGYLIAPLRLLAPDLPTYVWRLEEAMIRTAARLDARGARDPRNHGVWVGDAKLASVGIAVTRGVCWHGFALNVDPDLAAFRLIHPCGLDIAATSIRQHGVASPPPMPQIAERVAHEVAGVFDLTLDASALS